MSIALLDRRISFRSGPAHFEGAKRLSELSSAQYVVLLGEPGLGKTVALEYLAESDGWQSQPAFLFDSSMLDQQATYFIDAIDEVSRERALDLAMALRRNAGCKWRISCRVEDWSSGGMLCKAFGSDCASAQSEPVVAQLQPLDEAEASLVLTALGHPSPSIVLAKLQTLSSTPFVMTPLGLRFLVNVPMERLHDITRFELYGAGASHFAIEHNQYKVEAQARPLVETVLDTAGRIFFMLLKAQKHGVQRGAHSHEMTLVDHEVGIDSPLMEAALDTALFTKKGDQFIPLHRSIQEYLAARYLARLVCDGAGGLRLPIDRALALIVSHDGLPPESLRPLFAWFVAHLIHEGWSGDVDGLIQLDPEALLLHGDPAKLSSGSRAYLLKVMGGQDPYFRWTADGSANTCLAGLITPDLIPQVQIILETPNESSHRLATIFEALSVGQPISDLAESCWKAVERPELSFWCKEAALSAWVRCCNPSPEAIWKRIGLISEGDAQSFTDARDRLIAQLFCSLPADQLTEGDVSRLLTILRPQDNGRIIPRTTIPNLYAMRDISWHVIASPCWRPLIFNRPKSWRLEHGVGSIQHRFALGVCTAALANGERITVEEFASMMLATGAITGGRQVSGFERLAAEWVAVQPDLDQLVKTLLATCDGECAQVGAISAGLLMLGLSPRAPIIHWMLTDARLLGALGAQYVGLQAISWCLQRGEEPPGWLNELFDEIGDCESVLAARKALASHESELEEARARNAGSIESIIVSSIPAWSDAASTIETGESHDALFWGAEVYCGNSPLPCVRGAGPEALIEAFGESLGQAILTGLANVLLSRKAMERRDTVVLASAAILLKRQQPQPLDEFDAREVLGLFVDSEGMRDWTQRGDIQGYCIQRLSREVLADPLVLDELVTTGAPLWHLMLRVLASNKVHSDLHVWAARKALANPQLLSTSSLHSALDIAMHCLGMDECADAARAALDQPIAVGEAPQHDVQRRNTDLLRWAFLGACLRPDEFADSLMCCMERLGGETIQRLITQDYRRRIAGIDAANGLKIKQSACSVFSS